MKTLWWMGPLLFALLLGGTPRTTEAAGIKTAPDGCRHTHAILGWSTFEKAKQHKRVWKKVGWVMGRRKYLEIVDDYQPGVAQKASFRQFQVAGHKNGTAYVAECGHGGTCNQIALALYKMYKGIGTPIVYCGEHALPKMLSGGVRPEIPIPSDEDLAAFDEGGGDDDIDEDSFDDDDE